MTEQIPPNADLTAPRKKPSRGWYLLSLVLLVGSIAVFVSALRHKAAYLNDQIIPMPRFVAPTGDDAVVITVAKPGKQNIYYENLGELDGKAFNTPRRQVWTTYQSPSMTCKVWYIETGDVIEVRLPGVNDQDKPSRTSEDQIVTYDLAGRQGHSAWVFDADRAGDYRIEIEYVDAVLLEPGSVEVPPELTKAQKKQMLSADGAAYETDRREAIERAALGEPGAGRCAVRGGAGPGERYVLRGHRAQGRGGGAGVWLYVQRADRAVDVDATQRQRHAARRAIKSSARAYARRFQHGQLTRWSLTMPTACMNA